MLIRPVLSSGHAWPLLLRGKSSSSPVGRSLDQNSFHCPISLTAASRRSLGRVSVPVWGASLSGPLGIVAMVGRHPAIKLMPREPIPSRLSFGGAPMPEPLAMGD